MATNSVATRVIGVKNLPVTSLHANPHNPRMLFDRVDMDPLRDSIRHVGILVPLTVYREKRSSRYFILDGQRRWMCAQDVGLSQVPVNEVAEPDLVENIVTMFQIHKLRRDWELMPTALKVELLMEKVHDKSEKRLAVLTGLDQAVIVRCKKLLSFSRRYQDLMLDKDPEKRVKADFFIELYPILHDRWVRKFDWFKPARFTDAMLEKHEAKVLKSVTEFRVVKQQINSAARANRIGTISKRLREFSHERALPVAHLTVGPVQTSANARRLTKSATVLYDGINDIDTDEYYGENEMWDKLEQLAKLIRKKLTGLGRRLDQ